MLREIYKYMRVNDFEVFIDRDEVVFDVLDKINIIFFFLYMRDKEREEWSRVEKGRGLKFKMRR